MTGIKRVIEEENRASCRLVKFALFSLLLRLFVFFSFISSRRMRPKGRCCVPRRKQSIRKRKRRRQTDGNIGNQTGKGREVKRRWGGGGKRIGVLRPQSVRPHAGFVARCWSTKEARESILSWEMVIACPLCFLCRGHNIIGAGSCPFASACSSSSPRTTAPCSLREAQRASH